MLFETLAGGYMQGSNFSGFDEGAAWGRVAADIVESPENGLFWWQKIQAVETAGSLKSAASPFVVEFRRVHHRPEQIEVF